MPKVETRLLNYETRRKVDPSIGVADSTSEKRESLASRPMTVEQRPLFSSIGRIDRQDTLAPFLAIDAYLEVRRTVVALKRRPITALHTRLKDEVGNH